MKHFCSQTLLPEIPTCKLVWPLERQNHCTSYPEQDITRPGFRVGGLRPTVVNTVGAITLNLGRHPVNMPLFLTAAGLPEPPNFLAILLTKTTPFCTQQTHLLF